ncbi:hypothetical protein FRC08_016423 [Ceratobasidium sp. 394]|nr:hypothetical protein FRC08_016423 [Ceratobasidium sp. 394]
MSDYTPDVPTPGCKGHDMSVEYSHPTDEKPTVSIKTEDIDHTSELSNFGSDLATIKIHKEVPPYLCPPDSRTAPTHGQPRDPCSSRDPLPLSNLIGEPGRLALLNHPNLAPLLLGYFLSSGLPRNLSLHLSQQIATRFTAKIKACSNSPDGDSNAPSSQFGAGIPSIFGGGSRNFGFEADSRMWSGQGPGRHQLGLEQLQAEIDESFLLLYLAEKYRLDLVHRHSDPIRTLPTQSVNLSPASPVPLRLNLTPGPSYSTLLTGTGSNPDFDPGSLPPFDRPSWLIPNDYGAYGGVRAPTSNYLPTTPYSPWREGHGSSSTQPPPDLLTKGRGYNPYDVPQNIPEGQGNFQSVLAPAGVPGGMTSPDPGGYALGNIFASTATNGDQQFAAPGHSMSVSLSTTEHSGPHIPKYSQFNKRNSDTASQIGPKRTARKVCPVEGCGRTFPRPHLLEDHVNFVHKKTRGHRCTFPGCNKSYSNQTGMRKHYKDKHKSHDAEPSAHAGGSLVDRVPD